MQIYVFCEGKTEYNYIQSINSFLRDHDIFDIRFTPKNLPEGLRVNNYFSKIKQFRARDLKYFTHFYAWLDFDIFKRANKNIKEIEENINKISFNGKSVKLLLNYMNGEDFIILHEEDSKIETWKVVCNKKNHFNNPMYESTYLPLFQRVITGYKKSNILDLDKEKIGKCINNIEKNSIPFKSDIKEILEKILKYLN